MIISCSSYIFHGLHPTTFEVSSEPVYLHMIASNPI